MFLKVILSQSFPKFGGKSPGGTSLVQAKMFPQFVKNPTKALEKGDSHWRFYFVFGLFFLLHWVGLRLSWRETLQEIPLFHVKKSWFSCHLSLKAVHWCHGCRSAGTAPWGVSPSAATPCGRHRPLGIARSQLHRCTAGSHPGHLHSLRICWDGWHRSPKAWGKNPRCHEKLSQSLLLLPESMVQQLYCSILLNRFGIVHLHLNSILNSSVSFCKACWSWMLGRERKFSWLRPDSKKVRRSQLNSLKRGFKKAWRRLEGWRNVANLGQPWTSMETIVQNPIEELVLSGISGYVRHVFVVWLSPSWYSSDDEFL